MGRKNCPARSEKSPQFNRKFGNILFDAPASRSVDFGSGPKPPLGEFS